MKIILGNKNIAASLFLLGLSVPFLEISCARGTKKVIARYSNGNTSSLWVYPDSKDMTTFEMIDFFPDGKIFKTAQVRNNDYMGKKVTYFASGKVAQIDSLFQPQSRFSKNWDGLLIRYNQDGTNSQMYTVKDGFFNGFCKQYSDHGVLVKQYLLVKDSIKDGLYEEFYDDGHVSMKTNYVNGKVDGFAYFFNKDGDTAKYYKFNNNYMTFPYKRWLKNGQILVGEIADSQKREIIWEWYDKNGRKIKTQKCMGIKEGYFIP